MSKGTWIAVGVVAALLIGVIVFVSHKAGEGLTLPPPPPQAFQQVAPERPAPPPPPAIPAPAPRAVDPPPASAPGVPTGEVRIEDLESFKELVSGPFPAKAEWDAFVSRADKVARDYLDKKGELNPPDNIRALQGLDESGVPASVRLREALQQRHDGNQKQYQAFLGKLEEVYTSWGDEVPQVPEEAFSALVSDLIVYRSNAILLEDRMKRLPK